MNKEKKMMLWWSLAGTIFLMVGVRDVFFAGPIGKSVLLVVFEIIAGACFVLNAVLHWKKYTRKKTA